MQNAAANGCDSIIYLDLTFIPRSYNTLDYHFCNIDDKVFHGCTLFDINNQNDTIIYKEASANGCDSISIINLNYYIPNYEEHSIFICENDSVYFDDISLFPGDQHIDTIKGIVGCDSFYNIFNVEAYDVIARTENEIITVCTEDSLQIGNIIYYSGDHWVDTIRTANGCDSIYYSFSLESNHVADVIQLPLQNICQGDSITIGFQTYYNEGIFSDTIRSIFGCDSLVYKGEIEFNPITELALNETYTICEGDTLFLDFEDIEDLFINTQELQSPIVLNEEGSYILSAIDTNGCEVNGEFYLTVTNQNDNIVVFDNITKLKIGDSIDIQYSSTVTNFSWQPAIGLSCYDCPSPILLSYENKQYVLTYAFGESCINSLDITLNFENEDLYIPNVITKNSRENNSFFVQSPIDINYNIEIFDRWGNLQFTASNIKSNNAEQGFRLNENILSGVYVYKISYFKNSELKIRVGTVTVL